MRVATRAKRHRGWLSGGSVADRLATRYWYTAGMLQR
jgi:hypothetical protein